MEHNEDVVSAYGSVCDASHQIGEKVYAAIYVEAHFNLVDVF